MHNSSSASWYDGEERDELRQVGGVAVHCCDEREAREALREAPPNFFLVSQARTKGKMSFFIDRFAANLYWKMMYETVQNRYSSACGELKKCDPER